MAGRKSRGKGPADSFPGSIGISKFTIDLKKSEATLHEIQSSVRHSNQEVKSLFAKKEDQPNLGTYYSHWRNDLMQLTLDYFDKLNVTSFKTLSNASVNLHPNKSPIRTDLISSSTNKYQFSELKDKPPLERLSLIHISSPRDQRGSRMPSSA